MIMKKLITFFFLFAVVTAYSQKATNYWDGSFNSYWHNNNNWSLGYIPTAAEDVVIPTGNAICTSCAGKCRFSPPKP